MPAISLRKLVVIAATTALVLAACGGGGDDDETSTDDTSSTTSSTVDDASSSSSATTSSSSTASTTSTGGSPPPPASLPGQPTDFGPRSGGTVAVSGVAFDDVLNVRSAPGSSNRVVTTLAPTATAKATGNNRLLSGGSIWYEVQSGGTTGWAAAAFLTGLGSTNDITSQVISQLGSTPSAPTMLKLGKIVADSQASTDVTSKIVVVVAPSSGDLGEVTYDVIGLADDSVRGFRLHVFGQPGGSGFSLKSVEATDLCDRSFGSGGGLCA